MTQAGGEIQKLQSTKSAEIQLESASRKDTKRQILITGAQRLISGVAWPSSAFLLAAFYVVWASPRLGALIGNPFMYDDYYIGTQSAQDLFQGGATAYLDSWRPIQYLEYRFFDVLLSPFGKPFVFTAAPKLLGGLYVSTAAVLAYQALRDCSVRGAIAFLCLALFLVHPVVNEITLWNNAHADSLALCLALLSDRILATRNFPRRFVLASVSAVLAVLTYQFYLMVLPTMAFLRMTIESVNSNKVCLAGARERMGIFCLGAVAYLSYMWASTVIFGVAEPRGFVHSVSLSDFMQVKLHGVVNLLVNLTMPIVSFYLGIASGWKHWEAPFLTIALCAIILVLIGRYRVVVGGLIVAGIIGLPVLTTLPTFIISQTPESWRISVPAALAFALSLAAVGHLATVTYIELFDKFRNPVPVAAGGIAAVLAIVVGIVAHYDALQRVFIYKADLALTDDVSNFWEKHGISKKYFFVGRVTVPHLPLGTYYTRPPDITKSYQKTVTGSAFDNEFSWRGFLAFRGLHSAELESVYHNSIEKTKAICMHRGLHCALTLRRQLVRRCMENPDYVQHDTGRRVVHVLSEHISAVCSAK
jgi:hypothetical protein